MAYKYDLYLHFDSRDNTGKGEDELGWAENFMRFLRIMLRQFLGKDPVIYSPGAGEDQKPDPSELKVIVFIISPDTVNSPELAQLISGFREECDNQHDIDIQFAGRIFKIVKLPVPLSDQPEAIRVLLPFDLYDFDPASGKTREINDFFSQEAELNYWMKLVDLAYDIHESLARIDKRIKTTREESYKKSVFLAETGPELIVQRNMIKRELLRQGYQVHPDKNLTDKPEELSREVLDILGNCHYSIHLMGDHVVAGTGVSLAEVQNLAVSDYIKENAREKAEGFSRLIWLSPNFKIKDEREQTFLETMRRDLEEVGHTEIFQTPFEDFKFVLKNSLVDVSDFDLKITEEKNNSSGKNIYVIYDKIDTDRALNLAGYLKQKGFRTLEPSFEGDLMDIRQLHIQHLIDFDGVIIFAGKVNTFWVKMKLLDILKSPGFGRIKPLNNKFILIDSSANFSKEEFSNYDVHIIEGNGRDFGMVDDVINELK